MSSTSTPFASRSLTYLLVAAAGTGLPYAYAQVPPRIGLPNECVAAACGGKAFDPLRAISAVTATPNALRINQQAGTAILNWRDFNIANGNTVQFVQPNAGSVALNRIYDARLSSIDGKLLANGQVYLINPNGILFGSNARVDVAGLIASTLEMSDDRVTRGLLAGLRRGEPVAFGTPEAGKITVEPGAVLYAAGRDQAGTVVSAGRIFLFAPEIQNAGSVQVDGGGQVIFAAGSSVFLGTSTDPTLRGLLVEVNDGGRVDNQGSIQVARGNVTLMGLAVNQAGRVTATSAIRENGSIRLIAREANVDINAPVQQDTASALYATSKTGSVVLAPGSQTVVALDASDTGTAPLTDSFAASARSTIVIEGAQVFVGGNGPRNSTLVEARGGDILIGARTDVSTPLYAYNDPTTATPSLLGRADPTAVINIFADARIDASGLRDVQVDGARNFIFIDRLTTNDLRDAPLQRDGFLRGKGVWLNIGTDHPFIDTASRRAALPGTQAERNASGGTVALRAEGAVNVTAGATIDVSGGTVNTTAAVGRTSQLISVNGAVVDIMKASAGTEYVGFADELTIARVAPREGVDLQQTFSAPRNTRVGGYSEGKSAGTVEIYAPAGRFEGSLVGKATPSDQPRVAMPAGGQLRVGSAASTTSEIDRQAYLSRANLALGDDVTALLQSTVEESDSTLVIDTAMLKQGGFTRLDLTSDGKIELAADSPLDLGPGGQFKALGNAITVGSNITAAGGSIVLGERPLSVQQDPSAGADLQRVRRDELNLVEASVRGSITAPNASFSTAGRWTNDFLAPASAPLAPLVLNGGTIDISGRAIDVSNARFDVSAGATINAARKFSGGAGGNLSLALNQEFTGIQSPSDTGELKLGDRFAERVNAYGVSGGGKLSIGVLDALSIGVDAMAGPTTTAIDPGVANVGFSNYAFTAFNKASIAPNTTFAPDVRLVRFEQPLLLAPSAERLNDVAVAQTALPLQQKPTTISLATTNLLGGQTTVGAGSVIDAGVQGRVSVAGGAAVLVEGALRAPAGAVDLSLRARGATALSVEELAIRVLEIGNRGSIDVSGASLVAAAVDGTRTGNVLDAGSVSLNANSGYLVVAPEAKIAARGTSDVVTFNERGVPARGVAVASRGGAVRFSSDLGLYAQGSLDLHGGDASTEGGRLSVALNTPGTEGLVDLPAVSLFEKERRLLISSEKPMVPPSGKPVDAAFAGLGQIAPETVNASGADIAWLASGDAIAYDGAVALAMRAGLGLDAQTIRGDKDATLTATAPYVAIGAGAVAVQGRINRSTTPAPAASAGTAALAVQATGIDLVGDFSLQGIGAAKLTATADVRGIGTSGSGDRPAGALRFSGNLDIAAAQLYPSTFTEYRIEASAPASDLGRLTVERGAASVLPLAPLSAGGSLVLSAADVVVSGTVAAPLGAIEIVGSRSVTLAPGAEVTVAGDAIVPFGTVANGAAWNYSANSLFSVTTIASAQAINVPSKEVRISAPTVDLQAGSRINLQGGGETRASEFVPGPGGSFDVSLNFPDADQPAVRNPLFAVLPTRGAALAPYDPQTYRDLNVNAAASGSDVFRFGQTITIGAGSGLPAGTYTVLPPSYALLPGAFAVQPVSGFQDLSPQSVLPQSNGTFIVAGKLGFAAAETESSRWSGFRVFSGEQFRQLAEFNSYSGDAFFAAASKAQGANAPRLAADAAALSVDGARVRVAAEIATAASPGGRGAEVALSASSVVVTDQAVNSAAPQDVLRLNAAQLTALNAETLVIGAAARRSQDGKSLELANSANAVSVEGPVPLVAGEIILAAKDRVVVGPNSTLQANAAVEAAPPTRSILAEGDGAALWTTAARAETLGSTRTDASAPGFATRGTLDIGANTTISGRSVLFDASREQTFATGFALNTELATLSGATVNFGEIPAGTQGLNLTADLLAQFGAAKRLSVASASGYTAFGSATIGAVDASGVPVLDQLRLLGSGISGRGGADATVTLNAGEVILTNAGAATSPLGTGAGALKINATANEERSGNVDLGGNLAVSGFSSVSVVAKGRPESATTSTAETGELRFTGPVAGNVGLNAGNAELSIDAVRITAERGVRATVATTSALNVAATSAASDARPQELGASLTMTAREIDFGGRVDLPGGVVQMNAQGGGATDDVVLRSGANVSVAGTTQQFGPVSADASAGQVRIASAAGSVRQDAGARVDLRGAGEQGDAGALVIGATRGAVRLQGEVLTAPGSAARGAEISIDAARLDNLSELANALNAGAGGASASAIALRARSGNIEIAAADVLRAERIALAADGGAGVTDGSVGVAGQLIARGDQGGRVDVHARNQITLKAGSVIDARPLDAAPDTARDGGQVMLSARVTSDASAPLTLDAVVVENGARVDVSPLGDGAGGEITLRSKRVGNDVAVAALPSGALVGGHTVVEGVIVAPTVNGALTVNIAGQQAALQSYMSSANRTAMISRLGQDGNPSFSLRPGLEFRATGNITVAAPVDFALGLDPITGMGNFSYRYGGTSLDTSEPGALTLRAGGNLAINANISDGFTTSGLNVNPFIKGNSWRYDFAAGADLAAADPRQVVAGGTSTLSIGLPTTDTAVRTGTGSISLSAANDVVLRNGLNRQANVVYTGGVRVADVPAFPSARGIAPVITKGGGSIDVVAGRDILGADGNNAGSNQSVNEWLWRGGLGTEASPAVYWVNFGTFQQGFGALGGGDLTVRAGRDMLRVGGVVAGNGYSNGVRSAENNRGALDVRAENRIQQGLFFNQSGSFDVRAARIEADPARAFRNTRLAHGHNAVDVQVRETAELALPFNPTAFAPSSRLTPSLNVPDDYRSYMVTYGDNSRVSVRVAAGDLTANPFSLPTSPPTGSALLRSGDTLQFANVTAPSVDLIAFGGSIGNVSLFELFPSEDSSLRVLAGIDVTGLRATMSQADPSRIASLAAPVINSSPGFDPLPTPRQSAVALHANDKTPSAVVASTGSLAGLALDLVEASEIHAAKRISDGIGIEVQNANADSVTRITAGESIDFSRRDREGWIRIYGPGVAEVISGGPINLGTSFGTSGILSRGNLRNVNLPTEGASLFVYGGTGVDSKGFALQPDYLNAMRAFVRSDAFAAAGADAARLNDEAIATLRRNPLYSDLVAALDEGLKNRPAIDDPNSSVSMLLAKLSPAELAEGSLRLAASVQEAANRRFVATKNTDTFAPGYAAFTDLFPALSNNDAAVRSFVRSNPFAVAANGGELRERALSGLSPEFANVVKIGLADPASIDAPDSAFSQALAKLTPVQLQADSRNLLSNTLAVAGSELDVLRAGRRVDAGVGTPFAQGLSDFASSYSASGPVGANDIALFYSQIKAEQSGRVAVIDPRGSIVVGQSSAPAGVFPKAASELGIFTAGGGDIIGMARDNVDVFRSRVFTVAGGDVTLWSSLGNIDAGRGPRDVAVAPAPRIVVDEEGFVRLDIGGAVAGSGIGALKTRDDQAPSNIALIAPKGFIDAGEAGIRADTGTVTLGTNIVINAGNISASGGVAGGTVVAAAPPLPPGSALGGNAAERATEEARRAVAEEQNDAERRAQRSRKRVLGEFLGFGDDDSKDTDSKPK